MVVVMERPFPIDDATDVPEVLDMTRDSYGSLLVEAVFFLSLLEKLHEERVIEVYHRHHKPLLLLSLPHLDCQTPLRHIPNP